MEPRGDRMELSIWVAELESTIRLRQNITNHYFKPQPSLFYNLILESTGTCVSASVVPEDGDRTRIDLFAATRRTQTLFSFRNATKLGKGELHDKSCNIVLNYPDLEYIQAAARVAKQFEQKAGSKVVAETAQRTSAAAAMRGASRDCRLQKREAR